MMPAFDNGPQQPFFWNRPSQMTQAPIQPNRGFPPIFPSMGPPQPPAPAAPTPGLGGLSGLISSFLSPGSAGTSGFGGSNLFSMIGNAQKAIQTAQTVLPMIQQFGPMIKNAPALLSVLKTMQSDPVTEDTAQDEKKVESDLTKGDEAIKAPINSAASPDGEHATKTPKPKSQSTAQFTNLLSSEQIPTKPSLPRMYI
ncbi:YqfQ family protein [Sporolactobacillus kofuensis]|uniref:YqfQ family protein n=1 Tax=Sporolactobacillus kofuensis TaxID=269672 RepID=A0ABW1WD09_9BACL|nr:YqfQ family protein [Sporolactobacillus kofuensis]MCO7175699.1 YqfQ family protein [Sporolactobacillus kofuensis]